MNPELIFQSVNRVRIVKWFMALKHWIHNRQHIICAAGPWADSAEITFNINLFEPEFLIARNQVYATAEGRGTSYFFRQGHRDWVLKHYWRGGFVSKICKDYYFALPLKMTRPYRELLLLDQLSKLNLPAPKPIAARVFYHRFCYQADIITSTISDSFSLAQRLSLTSTGTPLDVSFRQIGKTINRFHRHNIYHDDLNAHNILINQQGEIFLIDFDKGKQMPANTQSIQWKEKNLGRLHRSLLKEKNNKVIDHFNEKCWEQLLLGYHEK